MELTESFIDLHMKTPSYANYSIPYLNSSTFCGGGAVKCHFNHFIHLGLEFKVYYRQNCTGA
jgi:hypothetical protein